MRQIFFLITVIFLLNQSVFAADSNLEEIQLRGAASEKKMQSMEEINEELNAKKAAAEPFNEKDVKVDVESLGLDSVDEKDIISTKSAPEKEIDTAPKVSAKKNAPSIPKMPTKVEAPSLVEPNSASINIKGESQPAGNKMLSKIQNFISGKGNAGPTPAVANQAAGESMVDAAANSVAKSLQDLKREKLRQRIARERKEAAIKKAKERKEAKEKRLNKLREEYLIKLKTGDDEEVFDEDFVVNSALIIPKEKSFRWSDRFVSYDPPALPILDTYRGNDNKHIPLIPTIKERVDEMFQSIDRKNHTYFNSTYQYVLDPNIHNANGETILTYATLFQKYGVMASILAKGADPDLPNALGHTAFDIAIEIMDMKSAQILVDMNADVNYLDGVGRTYLMHAARVGFLPMVDLLVAQGVDVNATDNEGFSALSVAYRYKKDVIVKFLLKSGAETWNKKPYNADQQNLIKDLENRWGNKIEKQ